MKNFLCKIELHKWYGIMDLTRTPWDERWSYGSFYQQCLRCGKRKRLDA